MSDGPTTDQENMCDELEHRGQHLRAAVAWRFFQGKGDLLSMMTGVPFNAIETFVKDGHIAEHHRIALDSASRGVRGCPSAKSVTETPKRGS